MRPFEEPLSPQGGLRILSGNLAPRRALRLFLDEVIQADEGCDFRFLRPRGIAGRAP